MLNIYDIPYYVINKEPLIIMSYWNLWSESSGGKLKYFMHNIEDENVYIILMLTWTKEKYWFERLSLRHKVKKYEIDNPKHRLIFLCNTEKEYRLFQQLKINSIFCNHNAFIDEKIYRILPNENKRYDAIYNARMSPFKRHELASGIPTLALITYIPGNRRDKAERYYKKTKKVLLNAVWLNDPHVGTISDRSVTTFLNQSKVGLCLSAKEGAMYASTEYLLCGLPVVSTKSIGGRDIFFDDAYVKIAKPNPTDVREAVFEMQKISVTPEHIRSKTLEKMKDHRKRFVDLIQSIYDSNKLDSNFQDQWDEKFINKMIKWF